MHLIKGLLRVSQFNPQLLNPEMNEEDSLQLLLMLFS